MRQEGGYSRWRCRVARGPRLGGAGLLVLPRRGHEVAAQREQHAEARVLAIKAGGACLEICRLTEFEGRPITFARLIYPGDKHQLVAQFSPHALPGS